MKKSFLQLLMFSIFSISTTNGQPLKPIKSQTISEIDELFEKYKGKENIAIYTPLGNIDGDVSIELFDSKAASIKISGSTENKDALIEFLNSTVMMKLKKGYKIIKDPCEDGTLPMYIFDNDDFKREFKKCLTQAFMLYSEGNFQWLFTKSDMYFTVHIFNVKKTLFWTIETGNTKRQSGKGATKFDF